MSDVQFDEPIYNTRKRGTKNIFVDFLIKYKIARNNEQAAYILLAVVGISFLITAFFVFGKSSGLEDPSYELINSPQPIDGSMKN